MYYTKNQQKHFAHERSEHDAAIANYAMVGLIFLVLSPVFVYLYHTITDTTLRISLAFLLLIAVSHITAKLLFHFFENYEKQGKIEHEQEDSHLLFE